LPPNISRATFNTLSQSFGFIIRMRLRCSSQ
jgi:hypothetical protein